MTEDSNTEYRSNLSIKTGGVTLDVLDVEFNKVSGEYKLSSAIAKTLAAIADGTSIGEVSVSGIFRADKSSVTVTVTSLQMGEEKLSADITLIALAKDTVPDYPGEVVEIFTLDEKAIEQLITKIEAEIGEFGLGDMP